MLRIQKHLNDEVDMKIIDYIFMVVLFASIIASIYLRDAQLETEQTKSVEQEGIKKDTNPEPYYKDWKKVRAKVTAYIPKSPSYGKYNDGKTSLGDDAFELDGVAVAPKAIPYRSKIYIPGVGEREADDTGSAMRKSWEEGIIHIDLRVKNKEKAMEWGVKWMAVYIKYNDK